MGVPHRDSEVEWGSVLLWWLFSKWLPRSTQLSSFPLLFLKCRGRNSSSQLLALGCCTMPSWLLKILIHTFESSPFINLTKLTVSNVSGQDLNTIFPSKPKVRTHPFLYHILGHASWQFAFWHSKKERWAYKLVVQIIYIEKVHIHRRKWVKCGIISKWSPDSCGLDRSAKIGGPSGVPAGWAKSVWEPQLRTCLNT